MTSAWSLLTTPMDANTYGLVAPIVGNVLTIPVWIWLRWDLRRRRRGD